MHLLVRETRELDEAEDAVDLGQSRADLVFLSFPTATSAHSPLPVRAGGLRRPPANARLRHPTSVDLYVEQVVAGARCVVIRLLGGLDYWRYGAEEIAHAARAQGIPLALLPGDGRKTRGSPSFPPSMPRRSRGSMPSSPLAVRRTCAVRSN